MQWNPIFNLHIYQKENICIEHCSVTECCTDVFYNIPNKKYIQDKQKFFSQAKFRILHLTRKPENSQVYKYSYYFHSTVKILMNNLFYEQTFIYAGFMQTCLKNDN